MLQLLSMYAGLLSPQNCHMHKIILWTHSSKVLCSHPFSACSFILPSVRTPYYTNGSRCQRFKKIMGEKTWNWSNPSCHLFSPSCKLKKWQSLCYFRRGDVGCSLWYCGVLLEESLTLVDPDGSTYQYVTRGWVLGPHNPLKSYANLMYIYVTMRIFFWGESS